MVASQALPTDGDQASEPGATPGAARAPGVLAPAPHYPRRIELGLFLCTWILFGFFHPGGGWNQNARFAMVRAMVEQGRVAIDSYLFYSGSRTTPSGPALIRTPIERGLFEFEGRRFSAGWPDASGALVPVSGESHGADVMPLGRIAATGDVAFARGSFHPNKAPGTALLAVPAYLVVYAIERALGIDPDLWWVLTLNAWLTSALSVGLVSAIGCVVFFRIAVRLVDGRTTPALLAALTFATGTLYLPYATMLFEHNVVVVGLLSGFYAMVRLRETGERRRTPIVMGAAGFAVGWAAISTYIAVFAVLMLIAYLFSLRPGLRGGSGFFLGLGIPFVVVCTYNLVCFGTPFTTNYHFQNPQFLEGGGAFLQVLQQPRLDRLPLLLVSPFRGLLLTSPVLAVGAAGWFRLARERTWMREAWLAGAVFGFFLLFNVCFNGWHGGWSIAPRYLAPGVAFLALGVAVGFDRWARVTASLALVSAFTFLLSTAVDPQPPVGLASVAGHPGRTQAMRSPLLEFELPLFLTGRAGPILGAQYDELLRRSEQRWSDEGLAEAERQRRRGRILERLDSALETGAPPFPLVHWHGPVSANPVGMYESWFGRAFAPSASEARWNSFNVGEFVFPRSRLSLLVLLALCMPIVFFALRSAQIRDAKT